MRILTYVVSLVLLEATITGNEGDINFDFDANIFASEENSVSDDFASGGLSASEKYDNIVLQEYERRGGESFGLDDFYSVVSQIFLAANLKPISLQSVEKRLYKFRKAAQDGSSTNVSQKRICQVTDAHKEIVSNLLTEPGIHVWLVFAGINEAFRLNNLCPLANRTVRDLVRNIKAQNGLTKPNFAGVERDRIVENLIRESPDMTRNEMHTEFLRRMHEAGFECQMAFRTFEFHINTARIRLGLSSKMTRQSKKARIENIPTSDTFSASTLPPADDEVRLSHQEPMENGKDADSAFLQELDLDFDLFEEPREFTDKGCSENAENRKRADFFQS